MPWPAPPPDPRPPERSSAPPPVDLLLVRVARGTEATLMLAPGTELAAIVAACRPGVPLDRSGAPD